MRAYVDEERCSGCALCEDMCPEVFAINDGKARVILDRIPPHLEATCLDAADQCPELAILIEGESWLFHDLAFDISH